MAKKSSNDSSKKDHASCFLNKWNNKYIRFDIWVMTYCCTLQASAISSALLRFLLLFSATLLANSVGIGHPSFLQTVCSIWVIWKGLFQAIMQRSIFSFKVWLAYFTLICLFSAKVHSFNKAYHPAHVVIFCFILQSLISPNFQYVSCP